MGNLTPWLAQVHFTDPEVQELVAQVQEEYVQLYGEPDQTPLEKGIFEPPAGAFFVAHDPEGTAVAMGGWRLRSDVHPWGRSLAAEVKRMYVVPAARRHGYARAVLTHLEDTARSAGADVMVLETGAPQTAGIGLYVAQGYVPIEKFGYYAWSPAQRCFGKRL
jgi:GNAT superfamily N-acetyltransferase